MKRSELTPNRDYCPAGPYSIHSFSDYSYWRTGYMKCDRCGYLDKTRTVTGRPVNAK